MNTSTAKQLLQAKRQWWEALAEHTAEGATAGLAGQLHLPPGFAEDGSTQSE